MLSVAFEIGLAAFIQQGLQMTTELLIIAVSTVFQLLFDICQSLVYSLGFDKCADIDGEICALIQQCGCVFKAEALLQ